MVMMTGQRRVTNFPGSIWTRKITKCRVWSLILNTFTATSKYQCHFCIIPVRTQPGTLPNFFHYLESTRIVNNTQRMQRSPQNWVLYPLFRSAAVVSFTDIANTLEEDHIVACEDWLPSKTAFNGSNRELTFRGVNEFFKQTS